MDDYGHEHAHAFPWISLILLLGAGGAYVACFVFAAMTKRLTILDYVAGTLGMTCGLGWMYFLYRANTVTLQHSFDIIEQGGDPIVARAINKRFKIAAGLAIGLSILAYFLA